MTRCTACECWEPRTRAANAEECKELGLDYDQDISVEICAECGTLDETLVHYDEDAGSDR